MGKFRRAAEAAMFNIKQLGDGSNLRVDYLRVEFRSRAGKHFGLRDGICQRIRGAFQIGALVAIRIGDRQENAPKTRPPHLIFRWKIRAAKKRFAIGK